MSSSSSVIPVIRTGALGLLLVVVNPDVVARVRHDLVRLAEQVATSGIESAVNGSLGYDFCEPQDVWREEPSAF